MKKLLLLLLCSMFIFSCREDYGNAKNENGGGTSTTGQFGFTVQRDINFVEQPVGTVNNLTFNIQPNYDYSAIQTYFKFSKNLDGVLKLNGLILNPNIEYQLNNKDNVFEYKGNEIGEHIINFDVYNSKGVHRTETFNLVYKAPVVTFVGTPTGKVNFKYSLVNTNPIQMKVYQYGFKRTMKVQTGGNAYLTHAIYTLQYSNKTTISPEQSYTRTYTQIFNGTPQVYEANDEFFDTNTELIRIVQGTDYQFFNKSLKIEVFNSLGTSASVTIEPTYTMQPY